MSTWITVVRSPRSRNLTTPKSGGIRLDMALPSIQTASHAPAVTAPTLTAATGTRNKILNLLSQKELEAVLDRTEMVTIESKEIVFLRREPIP
jgi:uncharacterized ferredoxin-like protein